MNLDRALKASQYLLSFSGTTAFSLAGASWGWTALVAVCACVAAATVDSGSIRPVRPSILGGILLASIPVFLYRWYSWSAGDGMALAMELGGFLCLSQALSFFGARRGTAIPIWTSMALLLLSARMNDGPDLILRIVMFLVAAAWFLMISSVSVARLACERSGEISLSLRPGGTGRVRLDRRYARQWIPLWGMAVVTAIFLGAVFFLAAPRALGDMAWLEKLKPVETRIASGGRRSKGGGDPAWVFDVGLGDSITFRGLARLKYDSRKALSLRLSGPAVGRISTRNLYLRGQAFVDYANGRWESPGPLRSTVADADDGAADGWTAVPPAGMAPPWPDGAAIVQDIEIFLQGGIGYFLCMAPAVAVR
ncbi:MAG: hypothetical protein N3A38_12830, partial [Planctomycetota bacterium]|nr:hypothetical protein [Planctomycetota bacterium]